MDYIGVTSIVLFDQLCADLGLSLEPTGTRFDPFPSGVPTESELSTRDFAKYALLRSIFKKSEVECSTEAENDTLSDFLLANEACWEFDKSTLEQFDGDPLVGYALNGARVILDNAFHRNGEAVLSMGAIESAARFGPGRSVGLGSKPSLLYFKVGDSLQTAGSEFVRSWYEISVANNAVCEAAEMARKARHGPARVVDSGNLTFVPKSYSRKRIVVTEPSLNTYFQLGVGAVMERVLSHTFHIDFTNQPARNAELARIGSITGEYATMDLKQCSDFISQDLVEFLFPPSVVRWLNKLRTSRVKRTVPPKNKGDKPRHEYYDLGMCGTMGNGFTFPLQTLLLSALVRSTLDVLEIDDEWGVFGDDIVIPTQAFDAVGRVLQTCGLRVNGEKSFASGSFRESCGSDWFRGTNVRGVYLKDYTSSQDIASAFNRLALWGATHDVDVSRTLCLLLQLVDGVLPIVPPDEPVTAGIRSPMPVGTPDEGGLWTYYPWRVKPNVFDTEPWVLYEVGTGLLGKPKKFREWANTLQKLIGSDSLNEPALLKVLLAGGIRRYKMFVREDKRPRYRQIRAVTPRWGFSTDTNFPREEEVDMFLSLQFLIEKAFQRLLNTVSEETSSNKG